MQTFLPFNNFYHSLEALDSRRLGKQRVEGYQILRTITGLSTGWRHHPAVKMWRGAAPALIDYTLTACEVWTMRGFSDTVADKIYFEFSDLLDQPIIRPEWLSDPRVLDSHKAMLYVKDPEYYAKFKPHHDEYKEYYWPV